MDFEKMWVEDKQSILGCMISNMTSDLEAGYDYFGKSIKEQRGMIDAYKYQMDSEMEYLKTLTDKQAQRWCKIDLVKRGAIEL